MKLALWTALILNFTACAYHFGPSERRLPGNAQKVYVRMFENRTQEVGIEADLTNAFVTELARSGVGTVVTNEENSDLILEGVIHTVDYLGKTPISIDGNRSMYTEYQTRLNIVLKAVDRNKKELWQGQFMNEKNYKAPQVTTYGLRTADPLYNQSARRQTIKQIAQDMAMEAVARMTENF